ncbi:MAG: DoxX family protein [Rhizobacter sp.]|nr:DoxX family protein [Ferruginibacter sp.]
MIHSFPFITQKQSILLLRCSVALVFFLHVLVRIINGTVEQFAAAMNEKGLMYGSAIVWPLTAFEIAGSILLALNYCTKKLCMGFIAILIMGIILIHAHLGWFVGEHGTGGVEYSFILIMALLVVAARDNR